MTVANYALCTLDDVKNFYGMVGSVGTDDDLLEELINNISTSFQKYCGVTSFKRAAYTEYYDGSGGKVLVLKNVPILSIASIYVDSSWDWDASSILDSADYRIVDAKYVVYPNYFTSGDQNIKITYTAGYTDANIPGDLKLVCIKEVVRTYKHRKDFEILSKNLSDGSAEYVSDALLPSTLLTLNTYKAGYIV